MIMDLEHADPSWNANARCLKGTIRDRTLFNFASRRTQGFSVEKVYETVIAGSFYFSLYFLHGFFNAFIRSGS